MSDDEKKGDGALIAIMVALALLAMSAVIGGGVLFMHSRTQQRLYELHQAERLARDRAMQEAELARQGAEEARAALERAKQVESDAKSAAGNGDANAASNTAAAEPDAAATPPRSEPKSGPPRDEN
jgi:type II secretory pathway pseudopilin PulG